MEALLRTLATVCIVFLLIYSIFALSCISLSIVLSLTGNLIPKSLYLPIIVSFGLLYFSLFFMLMSEEVEVKK